MVGGPQVSARRRSRSVVSLASKRTPGLDGTYSGTCIACLRPTDTALGVRGEAEWHAAFLVVMGVPEDEARLTVQRHAPSSDRYDAAYQVCGRCARNSPFPQPALALPGAPVPTIEQPRSAGPGRGLM